MYICTYVHMYIYTYIHICTYVHIYIYTYIQMVNGWGNSIHFWYMRWLRLVGSLKTEVSFAKEPYKRDYILQKRPIFRRSLLIHIYRVWMDWVYTYVYGMSLYILEYGKNNSEISCVHVDWEYTHIYGLDMECAYRALLQKRPMIFVLQGSFAKETYNLKEHTNRSHPTCICEYTHIYGLDMECAYGGATISRILKIISLFCKRAL